MWTMMIVLFLVGYLFIALEHTTKINKAGIALLTGALLWVIYAMHAEQFVPLVSAEDLERFLQANPYLLELPFAEQCVRFVVEHQVLHSIGEIAETLIFLIGAMITVELIDTHGGFMFITNRVTTRDKRKLLIMLAIMTFFMSAVLDNLTTAIVMIMLIRKIVGNYKERWVYASIVIIAANSGGAWSPIGDVTTIMLWVRGNISTAATIPHLFLPSLISAMVPVLLALPLLHGQVTPPLAISDEENKALLKELRTKEKLSILVIGVLCLVSVPIFKTITHLPPFMGILLGVSILWIFTELMYRRHPIEEDLKLRLSKVVHRVDGATLLFFMGILLAVDALRGVGILDNFSTWLDVHIGNVYAVNLIIGALSSIVDNVPLVAGAIGMYPVANEAMVAAAVDPTYMAYFMQDGVFWQFLAYCAGVGGSMLIIGSAAGVVVMGLEGIPFGWYLKRISWMAALGYLAGAAVYILQNLLLGIL
ncbi:Na+/H+ antiporter NhaD/arsenite permease-like protein [Parabacteroides sp. PFB2-12]|uniref:sodium:proton antiporter NhaD n=1 Tax=unclassified Parabacteroides TaxID=2649774 RepID=UPI0024736553|nr:MULTISPECIES: sodium:proton antiporter NhaD [unclassified Parabacteroides]MDH6342274.1 Na+/H+ antiporter NhaD/arsenite permease-like protein [Parabacteroides sp. PM6-13]MDH6390617.1 Na+/H+ antiporter NhaD/arsenite permease-like protein [Parabacteroides sp. PFB2-12]MDL2310002.1 sodium:proton antiporter NhaD [Parabacteroides sp. OttesenSCG-928-B22]